MSAKATMPNPMPGPFLGSMPSPDIGGARLSRQIDLTCSALAVMAAASLWFGVSWGGGAVAPALLLRACMAVLLAGALMGLLLMNEAAGWSRLAVCRIIEAVGKRLSLYPTVHAVTLAPGETPARGIAGLVEAIVWRVRRLKAPPSVGHDPASLYEASVRESRVKAQEIVASLYQAADTLGESSGEIEASGSTLEADTGAVEAACGAAERSVVQVASQVMSLTRSVETTTAGVRRMSDGAVTVAELAFASQRDVAALDDRSASLMAGAEQIGALLQRLAAVGDAVSAPGIKGLAQDSAASMSAMQQEVAQMSAEVAKASQSALDVCERVKDQHEAGLALSQAVRQQGDEIAAILRTLDEGRSGFVTLRASVEAVSRHGAIRLANADLLRQAAGHLPSHADAVAALLNDIPDFLPRGAHEP